MPDPEKPVEWFPEAPLPPPPPPPPGVSAGKRTKTIPAPPPIHPLTLPRCELTFNDGRLVGPARLVILGGHVRALDRRSRVLWESSILGWSRTGGSVELRVSTRETVSVRSLR